MSIWSWFKKKVSNISHAIGHAFSGAVNDVKSVASSVGKTVQGAINTGENVIKTGYNDAKGAVTTVYTDAKSAANKVYTTSTGMVSKAENDILGQKGIINNTESNLKSMLTMPLILIGVGVIFFAYNSKTNTNLSASYNR